MTTEELPNSIKPFSRSIILAIARRGLGLAALYISISGGTAAESTSTPLVRCGRDEAEMTLTLECQLPGSAPMRQELYVRAYQKGDEQCPVPDPSKAIDMMGTVTTTAADFGKTEVTFTIRQIPGPDRTNPYQIVIHGPFRQNLSGTIEGTKYAITWSPQDAGEDHSRSANAPKIPFDSVNSALAGPVTDSVKLSPSEILLIPHDPSLAIDVQADAGTGSGSWIRLQAKGQTGEVTQTIRIQGLSDPFGDLGTAEVAEVEVRAICAPYLPNSLEKKCDVKILKRATGDLYYTLLSNAAFANSPTPPAAQFRYLLLGVFRMGRSVAVVVGNFSRKDDVAFRMMMESLGRMYTLPLDPGTPAPPIAPKRSNFL